MLKKISANFILFLLISLTTLADGSEVRYLKDFNSLYIVGNINVRLVKSDSNYIVLKGAEEVFGKVSSEVKRGELNVKYLKVGEENTITIVLFYKNIDEIVAKAGVTIVANQVMDSPNFKLKLSKGAEAILEVSNKTFKVEVLQGSEFKVSGRTIELSVKSSAGSNYNGYGLVSDKTNLSAVTGGIINAKLDGDVVVSAHTGGAIYYKGSPKTISQKVSTGGVIKKKR